MVEYQQNNKEDEQEDGTHLRYTSSAVLPGEQEQGSWPLPMQKYGNSITILGGSEALLRFLDDHKALHPEFADLKKTFLNWETEILNYFIYGTTNAYIEGLNNRIETFKRKRWGFRSKESFIKCFCYMLFPISHIFQSLVYTHWF